MNMIAPDHKKHPFDGFSLDSNNIASNKDENFLCLCAMRANHISELKSFAVLATAVGGVVKLCASTPPK